MSELIDLAELMVEAGYLESFRLDEETKEIIFHFDVKVGFDVEREELDMDTLKDYFEAADDLGKKFSDELLRDLDNLPGWPDKVKLMQKNW
mgnify:CR=1 FL=1